MDKQKRKKLKTAAKGYAFIGINLIGVLIFWTVSAIYRKYCSDLRGMAGSFF